MLKYKKYIWLSLLVFGAACAIGGLILAILTALKDSWSWIFCSVSILAALGGGFLVFYALKCLKLFPKMEALQGAKAGKERRRAEEELSSSVSPILEKNFSRSLSLFILLLAAAVFLWAFAQAHDTSVARTNAADNGYSERATVVSIDAEEYQGNQALENQPVGRQLVTIELKTGALKGTQYTLEYNLSVWYGTVLEEGDDVIVSYSMLDGSIDGNMVISDYDRTLPLLLVAGLFILITVLVGGKIGLKSLLGLGLTFVCLFTITIPLLLEGWSTIPTILGMCAFVTVVEFIVLDGANKKTFCAIFGTLSGVALAAAFAGISQGLLRINGYNMKTVNSMIEELGNHRLWQQMTNGNDFAALQLSDLLIGGILIAALGAVNDVAMSISSSMKELITVNPNLSRKELFKSGMNIGRDLVGTMTNTLILAVAGSGLVMMIFYTIMEPTWNMMIDSSLVPIEVLQALASSAGVVLAIPVTVLIGTFLYGKASMRKQK